MSLHVYRGYMKIIGHRGNPENTIEGIKAFNKLESVEFDVRLHPSGILFLMHDDNLYRTTGYSESFADASIETLTNLGVPTLDDALNELTATAIIEMKSSNGTAKAVADVLNNRTCPKKYVVTSFDHTELALFKTFCPDIDVAPILYGVPLNGISCAIQLKSTSISISKEYLDFRLLQEAHNHGIEVNVFTVNTAHAYNKIMGLGLVSGIFTDVPDLFIHKIFD